LGRIEKDGQTLKENSGLIQVEAFSLEDFDQSGAPTVLMAVSRQTGGEYFAFDRFDQALESINTDPVREVVAGEASVWNSWWLLVLFIGSLAVEWVLRKLNHLL
jgi:hypothetical protein